MSTYFRTIQKLVMRNIILLALLAFFQIGIAQPVLIEPIKNAEIVKILNSIELISENKTSDLLIKVYVIDNEPGTAGYANGEITKKVYVAISEYGEAPEQSVFALGSFYAPKFVKWNNNKPRAPELSLEFINQNSKKVAIFLVELNKIIQK